MRITLIEAAAILTIGVVTMQLHSAERSNPVAAIQAFFVATSDRATARVEERSATAARLLTTAVRD